MHNFDAMANNKQGLAVDNQLVTKTGRDLWQAGLGIISAGLCHGFRWKDNIYYLSIGPVDNE
jgi:hypothetical protein